MLEKTRGAAPPDGERTEEQSQHSTGSGRSFAFLDHKNVLPFAFFGIQNMIRFVSRT